MSSERTHAEHPDDTPTEAAFRVEARAWLEANAPKKGSDDDFTGIETDEYVKRAKDWQGKLAAAGWACITWPKEYGGRGGTSAEAAIFAQEQARTGASSGTFTVGIGMAGPTIIAHGTDEQKRRWLPPLLRGEEVYCQLFSEPGAGSDLAGLACRAIRDGDEWIVNGQKVWTSGAVHSDLGILVARTDVDQPKHRGITYFIVDMHSPGIDIRPLRQMTGGAHFNEVFLTDVRIPHANVLGDVNGGWAVAMTTLSNERVAIGGGGTAMGFDRLLALAQRRGLTGDAFTRQGLADAFIRFELIRFLGMRVRSATRAGKTPGAEASTMKLLYAGHVKKLGELAMALEGAEGMLARDDAPEQGAWQQQFLSAPSIRIAGGSDEIQRNIIGERVLGLPPEPRPDKGVPFRDLLTNRI
jgi:alkylation response protein AidB-like acyl-CoA dehydrogenase